MPLVSFDADLTLTLTLLYLRRFVPLVFGLFGSSSEALQMAGADVLAEIVAKRMEPVAKLALVQQLRVAPVCARWRDALPGEESWTYDGLTAQTYAEATARLLALCRCKCCVTAC